MNQALLTKQLSDWQVLPKAERFTELFFADYNALPSRARPDARQTVTFVVRNFQGQTTDYAYTVTATGASETRLLRSGRETIAPNQSQTVRQTLSVPALGDRVAIKVTLSYKGVQPGDAVVRPQTQSIQYFVGITD